MAKGLKTGGRVQGTPNRSTDELRQTIQSFIENNLENLQINFELLEAKDKLMFLEKMLQYSLPRLQATTLTMDELHLTDEQLDVEIDRLTRKKTPLTDEERKARIAELKKKLFED